VDPLPIDSSLVNAHTSGLNLVVSKIRVGGSLLAGARLTRQELKSQDEITSSLQSFGEVLEARKKEVLIGIAVIIVLVLAFVGWRAYSAKRNAAASAQLAAAIAAFDDPTAKGDKAHFQKSAAEAQKTIDSYGSTASAWIARYYLALSQEQLGDTASATKNLQDVIDHGDKSVKGIAQFALAHIQAQHNEVPKAIETLNQLYSSGNYPKGAVGYEVAVLYENSGQQNKAQEFYSKVITEFPDSAFRRESESALKRLGVALPQPPVPTAPKP
jgi:predicted negative regulator of RcsB-dependent stress response